METVELGCGCGAAVQPWELAKFAEEKCTAAWTRCLVCGNPYGNIELAGCLIKRWATIAKTQAERIPLYTAIADLCDRKGEIDRGKNALRSLVLAYQATGHTLASSEDMLVAMLRFGGKVLDTGNKEKAKEIFRYIMDSSESPYAWAGAENLAAIEAMDGCHTVAAALLNRALEFKSIDPIGRARIELRLATACMKTFRFDEALTLATNADPKAWKTAARISDPVGYLKRTAIHEIGRYSMATALVAGAL